jgi:hypothetical protein
VIDGKLIITGHPLSFEGYQPGSVNRDGILSEPGTCGDNDQIGATVRAGDVTF